MSVKNSAGVLKQLRALMKTASCLSEPLHAYIIPSGDAHMSEYIAACDERRAFISGFTGSAGTAIVTETKAALWTDGRYYLQARTQMDDNWTLMKEGVASTLTQGDWLCEVLPSGGRVGVDPYLLSAGAWESLHQQLDLSSHALVPVRPNFVDEVWADRPPRPHKPLLHLSLEFTGMSWKEKVLEVRKKMTKKKASALVVSALDEVAWLLNLRGSDIEYNPVFFAYLIVTADSVLLFVDESKLTEDVQRHLGVDVSAMETNSLEEVKVTVLPYDSVHEELKQLVCKLPEKIWIICGRIKEGTARGVPINLINYVSDRQGISDKCNFGLANLVDKRKRVKDANPIALMKCVKNKTEIEGMRNAHIRDATALCEYFAWLEKEVPKGNLTEISASDELQKLREQQELYMSLSFGTISGVGPNGSIIHYSATKETNRPITTDELYLCDSGGQYKDGTTDVTRTVHFGTPSKYEQECFTRVLKGHISLCTAILPNGVKGHAVDTLARTALWEVGLEYLHGTGHGVGAFLNVHEGPCSISYRTRPDEVPLELNMILSDEPGFYEDGKFGIRIENLMLVVKANTKYNFKEKGFLTFEPLTLVPIQKKMILPELLTEKEVSWINSYHQRCLDTVGPLLKQLGKRAAFQWLERETEPLG